MNKGEDKMGHIHAAAMSEYAKDALETDMPWEWWEVSVSESGDEYRNLFGHPDWAVTRKYRRKQKVILINGHEVPEPHRTPLKEGEVYWTFTFFFAEGVIKVYWYGDSEDQNALKNGFIHLTKEAAEKHFDALKSFTAKGEQ